MVQCKTCWQGVFVEDLLSPERECEDCDYIRTHTCSTCGEVGKEVVSDQDGNIYCEPCADKRLFQCSQCGELARVDEKVHDSAGNDYCESCADEYLVTCDRCGDTIQIEESTCIGDGDAYCDRCVGQCTFVCSDCGERRRNDERMFVADGDCVCDTCFEQGYFTCQNCGEIYRNDDWRQGDVCSRCYGEDEDEDADGIFGHDYKPQPMFLQGKYDKSGLYFGIELETECTEHNQAYFTKQLPDWVYPKHDGSLDCGIEIVSHPATWQWLKKNRTKWENILALNDDGLQSHETSTCGMHVHMSKDQFSRLHLYKFLKLFYLNPSFILKISGRRSMSKLHQWARIEDGADGLVLKAKNKSGNQRYQAVNLTNECTVEIRIFKGTMISCEFWKNLEFCHAAFEFTRTESIPHIRLKYFLRWVQRHRNEYPNLAMFLAEGGK